MEQMPMLLDHGFQSFQRYAQCRQSRNPYVYIVSAFTKPLTMANNDDHNDMVTIP
jgi:hypothetical protein